MSAPPDGPETPSGTDLPSVAVITMARDEATMLPRWLRYYGEQVGPDNLVVLDDNTADGSTDDLPCPVLRLPPEPWKADFERTRMRLTSGLASGLLACYDAVVLCDVDEFLVPDPAKYTGLRHFLATRTERDAIAPVGLNVLHDVHREAALDPARPILQQRRLVKFAPAMCKPDIKRLASPWRAASHGIQVPYKVDPELWLLHLKFHDVTELRAAADHRHRLHLQDGRAQGTSWTRSGDELAALLADWTAPAADGSEPAEFDAGELDLPSLVEQTRGDLYRTLRVPHLDAMETSPLRRLPDRFRDIL